MPAEIPISNLNNIVWNRGFLNATRKSGTNDAIGFGALQNIRLSHTFEYEELYGPESLSPLGVGTKRENLSGSFENGVIDPEQFYAAMGGQLAYSAITNRTTWTKGVNDEPKYFDLHYVSDDTATPDVEIFVKRCLSNDWNIIGPGENRSFLIGGGSFKAFGDGTTLFTVSRPGNFTNAS
jgi:hypothetical protein